jgi:hypothetical protein
MPGTHSHGWSQAQEGHQQDGARSASHTEGTCGDLRGSHDLTVQSSGYSRGRRALTTFCRPARYIASQARFQQKLDDLLRPIRVSVACGLYAPKSAAGSFLHDHWSVPLIDAKAALRALADTHVRN